MNENFEQERNAFETPLTGAAPAAETPEEASTQPVSAFPEAAGSDAFEDAAPAAAPADEAADAQAQQTIPPQPAQTEAPHVEMPKAEIPHVEAERVENPIYSRQPYTAPYQSVPQQPYGSYRQPSYAAPQPVQPEKPKRKGAKIFAACVALLLVFAMGVGVASIFRDRRADSKAASKAANGDAPQLVLHETPTSVTKLEGTAKEPLTPAQIAAKVADVNVGILVSSSSASGEGSGIVMGEDATHTYTYIITCAHVIDNAGLTVRVQTADGTAYDAEIVGFDKQTDIGVLRIKATGMTAAEFGDSDALVVGDPVYAIGNPGGTELFGSFTTGYVSAIGRSVQSEIGYTMECIQHNAAISPGNSGGALVNQYGQVIGINSQKITATEYEGLSFAVPITQAKTVIDDLIKYSYVPNRAMLGITYYPVTASQQYYMVAQIKGLPAGTLIIGEIKSGSSLEGTNARKYDMIIAVDGKPMDTADVLLERIDNGSVGDKLTLTLCRVNSDYSLEQFDVEVTLVEDRTGSEEITTTTQQYVNPFDFFNQYGF